MAMQRGLKTMMPHRLGEPGWLQDLIMPFEEALKELREQRRGEAGSAWMPRMDVFARDDKMIVKVELPGMGADDVDITLEDGYIVISGEKSREERIEERQYYRVERSYGHFSRKLKIPPGLSEEDIVASYRNGILEISMPVGTELTERKKIPVTAIKPEEKPISAPAYMPSGPGAPGPELGRVKPPQTAPEVPPRQVPPAGQATPSTAPGTTPGTTPTVPHEELLNRPEPGKRPGPLPEIEPEEPM
ncbi:MAG: Hsp20/alpha crystallin family protein [Candidatus Geothermincolia bacterium]